MKTDRNCGMPPYPVYPMQGPNMMMGPMNPMMGPPMGQMNPMTPMSPQTYGGNQTPMQNNSELNSLSNKVNNLEKRVGALENMMGNNSNYNTSNFQMM